MTLEEQAEYHRNLEAHYQAVLPPEVYESIRGMRERAARATERLAELRKQAPGSDPLSV